ncbi:unnamed protein product [Kuraishia capsulata CBS 1993]|uniref:PHD-type domain-containing protein n=1 Tax=Kuraishia capsulata CBS 1993 TaxID=1382522 RepID=W6MSP4_9ASCO|nr:uncharacterized protein KUCA_T00005722001 [Kuraishia capsulata CBS 1993]CDK29729.1 unnamed protein product [Kuraishia capsulata CBS 1993]
MYESSKPREERDFAEFYPDLDETKPLITVTTPNERSRKVAVVNKHERLENLKKPSYRPLYSSPGTFAEKLPRNISSLGYNEHELGELRLLPETYFRAEATRSALVKNLLNFKDKFQVLYDMDEQDEEYLTVMNERRMAQSQNRVLDEVLEICFTYLEIEWYFIEKFLPPKNKVDSLNNYDMMNQAFLHSSKYGSDDGTGGSPDVDQRCAVCDESECDNSNAIVFCDGCDIAVHQECYGVTFIPEGSWLCRRCLISRSKKQRCLFCPSTTGAFKQTDNGLWGHVVCTLWINELYFANPIYMEPIEGLNQIPKGRWKLNCYICHQKVGACIQCCNKNCFLAYHATCARRSGLCMKMTKGIQGAIANQNSLLSYCDKHGPYDWNVEHDPKSGVEKTRLYFATVGAIKNRTEKLKIKIMQSKKSKTADLFKWNTKNGAPIIPITIALGLMNFLKDHHIALDNAAEVVNELCAYWTLKREQKQGAPLIKRLDATQYGQLTDEEIQQRISVLGILTEDVNKLLDLSTVVGQKSKVENQLVDTLVEETDLIHFPISYIISKLIDRIKELDSGKSLYKAQTNKHILSFQQIELKNSQYRYSSVAQFLEDLKKLEAYLLRQPEWKIMSQLKTLKRWRRESDARTKAALDMETSVLKKVGENGDLVEILSEDFTIEGTSVEERPWDDFELSSDLSDVEEPSNARKLLRIE